ncbi:DUF732 domain-containing protein [Mycobacterium sp.]|uniref:DUF732 domain-containing protein n=1 Tax=Mycobacterium sp. TaxID=1785 RepID=UPI003F97D330
MTHMKVGFAKWATICAVLLPAAALVSAAPASADQIDSAFLAALTKGGITLPDPNTAIAMAHTVCAGLDANQSSSVLAMKLMKDTDLSAKQAGYFIGLSVAAYCPQNKDKTDGSVTWLLPLPPLM